MAEKTYENHNDVEHKEHKDTYKKLETMDKREETNHKKEHQPHHSHLNVPYQAVMMLSDVKFYGDKLAKEVRHISDYSSKELEEKGITKNEKLNAEGLWVYVNHLAEHILGTYNFDPKDPRWKASYQAVNSVVKQFGKKGITTDVVEAVIGAYLRTAADYVAEKDQQMVASLPTKYGKEATQKIADLTGQGIVFGDYIDRATDPTEVAGIKSQLEPRLRETVNTSIATGTLEKLLEKIDRHEHNGNGDNHH